MISLQRSNENSVAQLVPYGAGAFLLIGSQIMSFTYLTGGEIAVMRIFQMHRESKKHGRLVCLSVCIFYRLILNISSTALPWMIFFF